MSAMQLEGKEHDRCDWFGFIIFEVTLKENALKSHTFFYYKPVTKESGDPDYAAKSLLTFIFFSALAAIFWPDYKRFPGIHHATIRCPAISASALEIMSLTKAATGWGIPQHVFTTTAPLTNTVYTEVMVCAWIPWQYCFVLENTERMHWQSQTFVFILSQRKSYTCTQKLQDFYRSRLFSPTRRTTPPLEIASHTTDVF